MDRNSPTKPEIESVKAEVPDRDACITESDTSLVEPGGICPSSPVSCEGTSEQSSDVDTELDPTKIVTKEMVAEERNLEVQGLKEEEDRKLKAQQLLDEVSDTTTEQRYERLKYLLSKSTMYTEYLVDRIKKQKEEEEKRRQRILQRRANKEKEKGDGSKTSNVEKRVGRSAKDRKRKACDTEGVHLEETDCAKKIRDASPGMNVDKNMDLDLVDQKESQISVEDPSSVEEPRLLEMASTFGISEAGSDSKRYVNGEEVPFLQPKLMEGGVLRPYQVEGYSWLKVLYENGVNGILADEMGLGKTVQCVAILAHLVQMGIPGPFLICAPLSTIPNWFAEFQRFAPKVPTILYHGHKDHRLHLSKKIHQKHKIRDGVFVKPVVITSYEISMIDRRFLAHHDWKYLIVDEGHRIKNTHCRLIRELRMYHSTHRLLLTGTPLQNNLAELWSLLNFLLPEIFDDKGSFETWFDATCISDETSEQIVKQEQGKNILSMLHQILTPFMLRRMKSDVDLCIPPKKELLVYAPLTQQQKEFYSALVDRSIFNILEDKDTPKKPVELTAAGYPKRKSASHKIDYSLMMEGKAERRDSATVGRKRWRDLEAEEKELESWIYAVTEVNSRRGVKEEKVKTSQVTIKMRNVMMQLRKCCNHPYLLEHPLDPKTGELALTEQVVSTSGKMMVLDRMLTELKKRGHRVLIFSQMTRMLDLIEDFCQIRGYDFCRLDGSTSVDDRRDSMNIFNANKSEKFLFLLSTRAGGLGVNLTGADTVIIYDSDWNPQCDLQAQDRCHRIGQTKPVVVYRFVTANTIDQKIIERAAGKRKLEKMVIHKGSFKSGNFTARPKPISPEELRELLNSKDYLEVKDNKFVISKSQLDALMDRSDLYELWEKNKSEKAKEDTKETPVNKSINSARVKKPSELFKVMDVDDGVYKNTVEATA